MGLKSFFKGAMKAYFVICGIGVFTSFSPNYSIAFVVLFFLGIVFFPIIWTKCIAKLSEEHLEAEQKIEET